MLLFPASKNVLASLLFRCHSALAGWNISSGVTAGEALPCEFKADASSLHVSRITTWRVTEQKHARQSGLIFAHGKYPLWGSGTTNCINMRDRSTNAAHCGGIPGAGTPPDAAVIASARSAGQVQAGTHMTDNTSGAEHLLQLNAVNTAGQSVETAQQPAYSRRAVINKPEGPPASGAKLRAPAPKNNLFCVWTR